MSIRYHSKRLCLVLAMSIAFLTAGSVLLSKGKPPKDDPPVELPNVRYKIDVVPTPAGATTVFAKEINNVGMMVGHYYGENGQYPYLYHQPTDAYFDFRAEASLVQQVDQLSPGWRFSHANAINDRGDIVGVLYDPATGGGRGYFIETGYSSQTGVIPAANQWIVGLLPDFGSAVSRGVDINFHGDVLGGYTRVDGTHYKFLYNPWLDTPENPSPAVPLGIDTRFNSTGQINNHAQVVDQLDNGLVVFFDPTTQPATFDVLDLGDTGLGVKVSGLNDAGVFAGRLKSYRINGKGKPRDVIYRYTSQLDVAVKEAPYTLFVSDRQLINSTNDLSYHRTESNEGVYLVHTGFSPDFTERVWNLDDLISPTDPLRGVWFDDAITASGYSLTMSDRSGVDDETGYPQFALRLISPTGSFAVVLTPIPVPVP